MGCVNGDGWGMDYVDGDGDELCVDGDEDELRVDGGVSENIC